MWYNPYMSKLGTGGDFAAFVEDLEREAQEEGPAAVAEMETLHEYYGLVSDLIKLRRHRGLTQKQLDTVTGIPQSEISRIESGRANPTLATLRTLVRALGGEIRIMEKEDFSSADR
jgi:ribosome-binding protein aMBF1 (putative translation factor)